MFLKLLVSLCCVVHAGDTLDVATVSDQRNAAAVGLSPVQSISANRMELLGARTIPEAINQFSGISIRDYGGLGGLKTVSIRNLGASHTAVVYDGIAISDAQNGQVDISRFSLDDIASVSVAISLNEDIFCSARHLISSGILRIENAEPSFSEGTTSINAGMTFGSFGTYIPYVSLKQKIGCRYTLKGAFNGTFSKGNYPFLLQNGRITTIERRLNNDIGSYTAEADFFADWQSGGKLKAKINYHDSERGLPGSVILYTQNAYERLWDKSLIANVMYEQQWNANWKLHADAGFSRNFNRHLDKDPVYEYPQDSRYTQNEYSLNARGMYMDSKRWKIVAAEDMFINTLISNIPECPFPVRITSISAISAQYDVSTIRIIAGLAGTFISENLKGGTAPSDRFRLSPVAGLSWNFHKNIHLRACFKEGFRVPTFNDLYYARVGNVNLKPEIARQVNLGLTFSGTYGWGTADITADGYYNFVKDKIIAVPTMFIWKMRNVGEVEMYGADLTASAGLDLCKWLRINISGNYSLQYALDITDPESKNYRHQIPYAPRHTANGYIIFETDWFNISYRLNFCGKRYVKSQNITSNEIKPYADHSITLNRSFEFGKRHSYRIALSLEGLNLSDNNYEIINYYPMPGRSYRLTIKFRY